MVPAVGSLLWTASSEAVGDELDLQVTATHLMPGSASPTGGAIVLAAAVVVPESTGTLKLASTDPDDAPLIDSNYVGTGRDARRMLEGFKIGREITRQREFARFTAGELMPGDSVSDDDVAGYVQITRCLWPFDVDGSDGWRRSVVGRGLRGVVRGVERLRWWTHRSSRSPVDRH
jgi:choline dehydrogenase